MVSHVPLQWAIGTFAESFSSSSLPHFSVFLATSGAVILWLTISFNFFMWRGLCVGQFFFHSNGYSNYQNSSTWSAEIPRALHGNPLHSSKIGVWCALSRRRKKQLLRKIIQIFYSVSLLCWKSINGNAGFSKVGEIAHTAKTTFLQGLFGYRTVCRGLWPPRSPDRRPPDFFLCGFLKDRVYCNKPRNMEDRKPNTGRGGGL